MLKLPWIMLKESLSWQNNEYILGIVAILDLLLGKYKFYALGLSWIQAQLRGEQIQGHHFSKSNLEVQKLLSPRPSGRCVAVLSRLNSQGWCVFYEIGDFDDSDAAWMGALVIGGQ